MSLGNTKLVKKCSNNLKSIITKKSLMLVYARLYGRKISAEGLDNIEDELIGNIEEMNDNLKYSQILYRAIKRGSEALLENMGPVFETEAEIEAKQCMLKTKKKIATEVNAEFIA